VKNLISGEREGETIHLVLRAADGAQLHGWGSTFREALADLQMSLSRADELDLEINLPSVV
jgi:hypothetical protein